MEWITVTNCLLAVIAFLLLLLLGPSIVAVSLVIIINTIEFLRERFNAAEKFLKNNWLAAMLTLIIIALIILIVRLS